MNDILGNAMPNFMSPGQRALLQQLLQLRLHELDRRIAQRDAGGGRAGHAHDVLQQDGDDAPQREGDRQVDLARADREIEELGAVSEALARVHDADFGLCVDCGEAIPFDRLKLEPRALRCVGCERKYESATPRSTL